MLDGYDQAFEDELFGHIDWPVDGYRLFDIGHFIGERDWFDGLWESNCIFVPRKLLEQVGAFDERFSMPGGGYANLEFYERLGATPGVNVVDDPRRRLVPSGARRHDDQRRRRRRPARHDRPVTPSTSKSCGAGRSAAPARRCTTSARCSSDAARTRARRMTADAFVKGRVVDGPDGFPTAPTPIPDELKLELHRRVVAQPRVAQHDLARSAE